MSGTLELVQIFVEEGKGRQGKKYTEYFSFVQNPKLKGRIEIYTDSYDFQSHATVEVMDGLKWSPLASIHYSNMQSNKIVQKSNTLQWYEVDRDVLVHLFIDLIREYLRKGA